MVALLAGAQCQALRSRLCKQCIGRISTARSGVSPHSIGLQGSDTIQRRSRWHIAKEGEQAHSVEGFYGLLSQQPHAEPGTRTAPAPPPPEELPKTEKEKTLQRARIVFGSRLAGPAERKEERRKASTNIAGVLVPPKPEEPDNCCMSGCVNCVWDIYRDDLEEWAQKNAEAQRRLQELRLKGEATGTMVARPGTPAHVATSMDDDGGGSETNWPTTLAAADVDTEHLFDNIPVGIREFMRTEKKLKLKHMKEEGKGVDANV